MQHPLTSRARSLHHHCFLRSGLCPALLLIAGILVPRALSQPLMPGLHFTIVSQTRPPGGPVIAAVGQASALVADALIIGGRFDSALEPVLLSISSPLLESPAYAPLWLEFGSRQLTAYLPTAVPAPAPGVYDVVVRASTADWLAYMGGINAWLDAFLPPADRMETTITRQVTIVSITNLTASAYHVAIGDTVTNTVTMIPVTAGDLVHWDEHGSAYDGTGETYTRVMTDSGPWGPASNGVLAVTATCGNVTLTNLITVYQLTGMSVSEARLPMGGTNTFTVTIDPPGGSPPPVEWFVNGVPVATNTGTALALLYPAPGYFTITAKMGASCAAAETVTVVGIRGVLVLDPDLPDVGAPAGTEYIPLGYTYGFGAYATPANEAWPAGWPQWTIDGTPYPNGSNVVRHTFNNRSSDLSDFKRAIVACGSSSNVTSAIVYEVNLWSFADPDDMFTNRAANPVMFGLGEIATIRADFAPTGLTMAAAGLRWDPTKEYYQANSPGELNVDLIGNSLQISKVSNPETNIVRLLRGVSKSLADGRIEFIKPNEIVVEETITTQIVATNPATGQLTVRFGFTLDPEKPEIRKAFKFYVKPDTVSFRRMSFGHAAVQMTGSGSDLGMDCPLYGPKDISATIPGLGARVHGLGFIQYQPTWLRTWLHRSCGLIWRTEQVAGE